MTVYFSVLSERTVAEKPFRKFMAMAVRAGELGYKWLDCPRMRTDTARDAICAEFRRLASDPNDILIMLDNDHLDETTLLEQLVADDKPVVAALAFRGDPTKPDPCFWTRDANGLLKTPRTWEKGLVRAAIVGTGAIAIKRSVFTALDNAGYNLMNFFYQYNPQGGSMMRISDEIGFSQMLEELNIETYVDTRLVIPHCADAYIAEDSWEEWCRDHPIVKREHKVSVVVPLRGRLEKTRKMLDTLFAAAPDVECILLQDLDDKELEGFTEPRAIIMLGERKRAIDKWNEGAVAATGDILMLASNDVTFENDWLKWALDAFTSLPNEEGVVGTNDTFTDGNVSSPHYLASRKWLVENYGGALACPEYAFQFIDYDICGKAQSMGKYVFARAAKVLHPHPLTGSAVEDEIHQIGYKQHIDADRALYVQRRDAGFPVVWKGGLK